MAKLAAPTLREWLVRQQEHWTRQAQRPSIRDWAQGRAEMCAEVIERLDDGLR